MCGIWASIGFAPDPARIDLVKHRGPDGDGWRTFSTPLGPVALGHRRLARRIVGRAWAVRRSDVARNDPTRFPAQRVRRLQVHRGEGEPPVTLALSVDGAALKFSHLLDGEWRNVGPVLDASILSDEAGGGEHRSFTGAFVGMFAFDASGAVIPADFKRFEYEARDWTGKPPNSMSASAPVEGTAS